MDRPIHFCKTWFRAKKRPTQVWKREQARGAHAARKLYSVLVGAAERPFCFLEINDKFAGVGFLDDKLRETLYDAFKEVEPGTLFLSMATYRSYEGDTDAVAEGTTYVFSRDGTVKIQKSQFQEHATSPGSCTVDVSANYSPWPAFGEYDDLIRMERQA